MCDYIEINTDYVNIPIESENLIDSRANAASSFMQDTGDLSIAVISYNRVEKTKVCVENLLKNTNMPFRLILIDSGSQPDVMDFYKSVAYENKQIIRITKNVSANYSFWVANQYLKTRFCAIVSNDVIVTPNAIENLYKCISSSNDIGWVTPVSSNVSNQQKVDLEFNTIEEMHEKAALYNQSNPLKWHERMVLMPPIFFYRKECMDVTGGFDYGFFHDFADDDMARRFNYAGYKTILCKDTWVHHNHSYNLDNEKREKLETSIKSGRANFQQKFRGLDAWDDIRNFEIPLISQIKKRDTNETLHILGVDTRSGTPILEIKNKLKEYNLTQTQSQAFTTHAKYYADLQTICQTVNCDRIDFILEYYSPGTFDYIILGEPINTYPKPFQLGKQLYNLLKPRGTLLFNLRNTSGYNNALYSLGYYNSILTEEKALCISAESINQYFTKLGAIPYPVYLNNKIETPSNLNDSVKISFNAFLQTLNNQTITSRLLAQDYSLVYEKPSED